MSFRMQADIAALDERVKKLEAAQLAAQIAAQPPVLGVNTMELRDDQPARVKLRLKETA